MLADDDAFVRRAAADALARHPHADNIALLLELWDRTPPQDTHLIHTVRMALRDQLRATGEYDSLAITYGGRPMEYSRLLDVSLGVRDAASAEFVLAGLQKVGPNWPRRSESLQYALTHLADDRLKDGVAFVEAQRGDALPAGQQAELLRAASHAFEQRGAPFPDALRNWSETLAATLLASKKQQEQQLGVAFARDLKLREALSGLLSVAGDPEKPTPLRGDALEACATVSPAAAVAPVADLLQDTRQPPVLRTRAARALTGISRKEARDALAAQLPLADFQLAVEIATGLGRHHDGAEQLLDSIKQGKASPQLLMRRDVQLALRVSGLPDWQERIDGLTEGVTPLDEQIAELLDQRRRRFQQTRSDLTRGAEVFKKTCAACHRLGKQGEKVGPELDGIGHRGLARLLEDVLDPNRVVDPAFHTTVVQTSEGRVLSGLALESEGKLLVLVDREGKQFRIPIAEIRGRRTLPVSPMPANLAEAVPAEDLNHLLAFLLSQRQ
jgi:putative heme-binding domain-containing protein